MSKGVVQQKSARLHSLDFLRGLFLIIILVNHIALFPNLFMLFTGKSQLWMSAAEGFMVVSGLLIGYIYTRKMKQEPVATSKNILRRALKVYIATILLGLFCMFFVYFIDPMPVEGLSFVTILKEEGLGIFIAKILSLSFSYYWSEFLANYAIFIALAPLALWLVAKKKAWVVLIVSTAVWLYSFNLQADNTTFIRTSWQFIFFVSLIIGAYLTQIKGFFQQHLSKKQRTISLYVLWVSAAIVFVASTFLTWGYSFIDESITPIAQTPLGSIANWWWSTGLPTSSFIEKSHLGLIRLSAGVIVFWALFTFAEIHLKKLNVLTGSIIERTGRKGLMAYIIHSVIALVVLALPALPVENNIAKTLVFTLMTALAIYLLYFFTHRAPLILGTLKASRNQRSLDAKK